MRGKRLLAAMCALVLCAGCQGADQKKEDKAGESQQQYSPIVSKKKAAEGEYPYEIRVNKKENCITVYGMDDTEKYIVPLRAMICSAGEDVPLGTFQLGDTSRWQMEPDGTFSQYASRIVDGVVFHSAPYLSQNNQNLNVEQFNKMGEAVTGSSIQLETADAKWIADNCPEGTKVDIYEEAGNAGALGKPKERRLASSDTADPTDKTKEEGKDSAYEPVIFSGVEDLNIAKGQTCELLEGVTAADAKGNDLTAMVEAYGSVDTTAEGSYEVTYVCKNHDGEARAFKRVITVEDTQQSAQAQPAQESAGQAEAQQPFSGVVVPYPDSGQSRQPANTASTSSQNTAAAQETEQVTVETVVKTPKQTETYTYSTNVETIEWSVPLEITITAKTRYTHSVDPAQLRTRVSVTDYTGTARVYTTVQKVSGNAYVVVYEALDDYGNSTCVSETVFLIAQ